MVPDHGPVGRHRDDGHHVEPHRHVHDVVFGQEGGGDLLVPVALGGVHRLGGQALGIARTRLHLHEHHGLAVARHDVGLAGEAGPVARDDVVAPPFQKAGGGVLSPPSELLVALSLSFGLPLAWRVLGPGRPSGHGQPRLPFLFPFGAPRLSGRPRLPHDAPSLPPAPWLHPFLFASHHRDAAQQSDDARPAKGPSGFP